MQAQDKKKKGSMKFCRWLRQRKQNYKKMQKKQSSQNGAKGGEAREAERGPLPFIRGLLQTSRRKQYFAVSATDHHFLAAQN